MGTDNLFHKRKTKNINYLARKKAKRAVYSKVLIVCEGEKTEPLYFAELKDFYEINSANIEIIGDCNSCPTAIVEYAKNRFESESASGDSFDNVFCVFDKDTHSKYEEALLATSNMEPQGVFEVINSIPCFEYWLLLHFIYSTKPYAPLPNNSMGEQLLSDLKKYMPDYTKNKRSVFSELKNQLEFAKENATRSLAQAKNNNTDNPSTMVQKLVTFLQNIKS